MVTGSSRSPTCGATCRWNSAFRPSIPCGRCGRWWTRAPGIVAAVRPALLQGRPALDPAGALVARAAAAGALQRPQRAACSWSSWTTTCCSGGSWAWPWTIGSGTPRCSPRTGSGCSRGDIAHAFFERVRAKAEQRGLLSDEHFTVDGTLIDAWASLKSFQRKDAPPTPPDDPGNPTVNFHGERRSNATHASTTDPQACCIARAPGAKRNSATRGTC